MNIDYIARKQAFLLSFTFLSGKSDYYFELTLKFKEFETSVYLTSTELPEFYYSLLLHSQNNFMMCNLKCSVEHCRCSEIDDLWK